MPVQLPVEVVTHIMRFLSVSDRKESALVCRSWYEASLDPILQRDIIIHFYASSAESTGKAIPTLSRRRLPHLVLNGFDSSLREKTVVLKSCEHLGANLKSLSLKGSSITEHTIVQLLSYCKNLVSLDLSCCNSLFMAGTLLEMNADLQLLKVSLANVTEVNLSSIRHLTDVTFNRIMTVCENVEKVSLASAPIVFGHGFTASSRLASGSVLSFKNIMNFVITQPSLTSLNLSRTQIEDEYIEELVSSPGLHLQELVLTGCRNVSDDGIAYVCKHQPQLHSLDLRECNDLSNSALMTVTSRMKQLKNLYMNKCKRITDKAVCSLSRLHFLQVLDLSDCHHVSCTGLIDGLCNNENITLPLTHLNLSCTDVGDAFVEKACIRLPFLNHLDLGSCFNVTDISVHAVASNLKYLRYLRLAWCSKITDLGLLGLQSSYRNGRSGDEQQISNKFSSTAVIQRKSNVKNQVSSGKTDQQKDTMNHKPVPLNNVAGLHYLDLTACKQLTDTGLIQVVKFAELRVLGLAMLNELSDDGLAHIIVNNPSLEEVNVSQCQKVSDFAMETLTKHLPRLHTLNVMGCRLLTDKTVSSITRNCKRLRHLDVSFCSYITHNAMNVLEDTLTNLITVQRRMIDMK